MEKDRAGRVRESEEAAWAPQGLALSRDWLAANMSLIPPGSVGNRGEAPHLPFAGIAFRSLFTVAN